MVGLLGMWCFTCGFWLLLDVCCLLEVFAFAIDLMIRFGWFVLLLNLLWCEFAGMFGLI